MTIKAVPYPPPNHQISNAPLRIHRCFTVFLWLCAIAISVFLLDRVESLNSLIALLSSAAILATLGSAICASGSAFERDLVERFHLDLDIFFSDIVEQTAWRRWPFLRRRQRIRLLNGDKRESLLYNPRIKFDVGSHIIEIDLPTVAEDFFDLPITRNTYQLLRYQNAAITTLSGRDRAIQHPKTGLTPSNESWAYACLLDIWIGILKFRVCRYAVHFGVALTISAIFVTAFLLTRVSG